MYDEDVSKLNPIVGFNQCPKFSMNTNSIHVFNIIVKFVT